MTDLAQLIGRLEDSILSRETSAEIEEAVHAALQPYLDKFNARDADKRTLMMVRAACEARDNAKRFRREAEDLTQALRALQAQQETSEDE